MVVAKLVFNMKFCTCSVLLTNINVRIEMITFMWTQVDLAVFQTVLWKTLDVALYPEQYEKITDYWIDSGYPLELESVLMYCSTCGSKWGFYPVIWSKTWAQVSSKSWALQKSWPLGVGQCGLRIAIDWQQLMLFKYRKVGKLWKTSEIFMNSFPPLEVQLLP